MDDVDMANVQGDILNGLPKKTETFYFFQIISAADFKQHLSELMHHITTADFTVQERERIYNHKKNYALNPNLARLTPYVGVNISFTHLAFEKLGVDDSKFEQVYRDGQRKDSESLGDNGTGQGDTWEEPFKQAIDGVIIVAAESRQSADGMIELIEAIFGVKGISPSIKNVTSIRGDVRPGAMSAHEHFGFLDGISDPLVKGIHIEADTGPKSVPPGIIILGHEGDPHERDAWMVDGSFMVFRYLRQKVPEFDNFLERKADLLDRPGLDVKQKAELLGARLMGRWKSGAPVDVTPFVDIPDMGKDPLRNNNFHYHAEIDIQKLCPYAAHIRKAMPRADLTPEKVERRRIMRRGIQFGDEVTLKEKVDRKTKLKRGLLFVCYQSSIENGFRGIQLKWSNEANFPKDKKTTKEVPGLDPIIGQGKPEARKMSGFNPDKPSDELEFDREPWVVPLGGEYFFSPSIKGLAYIVAA